jgi:hypothetical protein
MLKTGIYEHFKGGRYYVIGTATHSETGEELVVYQSFRSPEPRLWVRPLNMFEEFVTHEGQRVPRFQYICR